MKSEFKRLSEDLGIYYQKISVAVKYNLPLSDRDGWLEKDYLEKGVWDILLYYMRNQIPKESRFSLEFQVGVIELIKTEKDCCEYRVEVLLGCRSIIGVTKYLKVSNSYGISNYKVNICNHLWPIIGIHLACPLIESVLVDVEEAYNFLDKPRLPRRLSLWSCKEFSHFLCFWRENFDVCKGDSYVEYDGPILTENLKCDHGSWSSTRVINMWRWFFMALPTTYMTNVVSFEEWDDGVWVERLKEHHLYIVNVLKENFASQLGSYDSLYEDSLPYVDEAIATVRKDLSLLNGLSLDIKRAVSRIKSLRV